MDLWFMSHILSNFDEPLELRWHDKMKTKVID
jgi:hypothetical protein